MIANNSGMLPAAPPSPRIVGGVLKWYEGDIFDLQIDLALTDQNGAAVEITEGQTLTFRFRNERREVVHEVCFAAIEHNRVTLCFTEAVTALFPKGSYTYDVIYDGFGRRTLAHNGPVKVE